MRRRVHLGLPGGGVICDELSQLMRQRKDLTRTTTRLFSTHGGASLQNGRGLGNVSTCTQYVVIFLAPTGTMLQLGLAFVANYHVISMKQQNLTRGIVNISQKHEHGFVIAPHYSAATRYNEKYVDCNSILMCYNY